MRRLTCALATVALLNACMRDRSCRVPADRIRDSRRGDERALLDSKAIRPSDSPRLAGDRPSHP